MSYRVQRKIPHTHAVSLSDTVLRGADTGVKALMNVNSDGYLK